MRPKKIKGRRPYYADFVDEDGASLLEVVYHMRVVDDLMAHIYGRAKLLETQLHHINGAHHTSAESSGSTENDVYDGHPVCSITRQLYDKRVAGWKRVGGYSDGGAPEGLDDGLRSTKKYTTGAITAINPAVTQTT